MWPRSQPGVIEYRARLRRRECGLILDALRRRYPHLGQRPAAGQTGGDDHASAFGHGGVRSDSTPGAGNGQAPRVLEFGSGGGHQLPVLAKLGTVVGSDVYRNRGLVVPSGCCGFALADISRAPYADRAFDVVYSNHVLEHVPRLEDAFAEMLRIGTSRCVYAFSVPTPLWLFLSLPAKYLDRAKRITARILRMMRGRSPGSTGSPNEDCAVDDSIPSAPPPAESPSNGRRNGRLAAMILPQGHGEYRAFWQAFLAFRKGRWIRRFEQGGLRVVACENLLLYATARWPFIPMNRFLARIGIASSRLFILERGTDPGSAREHGARMPPRETPGTNGGDG